MTGIEARVGPLVGRGVELALLTGLLEASGGPAGEQPQVVLLGGDAGIGKTRLLRELMTHAIGHDRRVLVGHCLHHGGDTMPYLPVIEAFGRLSRAEPELAETLREHHPALGRLLPRRLGAGQESGRIERAELFEAVVGAVIELAADRPLLLVLEDLHWADEATRDLFGFLATRLPGERVLLVASYRADDLHRRHPLRAPLAEWTRLPAVVRMTLEPLSQEDLTHLVHTQDGEALDARHVADIVRRADGNAFFAEQLVAEAEQSGGALPADLAELLLLRLERLSAPARRLVRAIAVSGRWISHGLLAEVSTLPEDELDAALREAVDAHVLERRAADRYAFRHALLAEAVYDDLLPGERARLHADFARVLRHLDVPGVDAELARHAREAGDVATAYSAALRAGDEAIRLAAPAEARVQYLSAIGLAAAAGDRLTERRAAWRLAIDAARATDHAGHPFQAIRIIEQALAETPGTSHVDVTDEERGRDRAELLVELVALRAPWDGENSDLVERARAAVDAVPAEPPSALRARAMELYARALNQDGDPAAGAWAAQARAMAQVVGDAPAAINAAVTQARYEKRHGDAETVMLLLDATREEIRRTGDVATELRLLHTLGNYRVERADVRGAAEAFDEAVAVARRGGRPWSTYGQDCLINAIRSHAMLGEWDLALDLATALEPPPPDFATAALSAVVLGIRAGRGEQDAVAGAEAIRPWWTSDGMIGIDTASALIDLYGLRADVDAALAVREELARELAPVWGRWFQARIRIDAVTLGVLADHVAAERPDRRRHLVDTGAELLADVRRTVAENEARALPVGTESQAWIRRAEAEHARVRWRADLEPPPLDELVDTWRRAVDGFDFAPVFERARSRARLAAVLQAAGHREQAQHEADLAREVARRLQAEPLLGELRALAARPSDADTEARLTPREQQVLNLVAAGRTNRQIGRELFISDKTVSVHVSNVLAKLGAGGRTEAAALARRQGLLD